jgi:hypothetical protein
VIISVIDTFFINIRNGYLNFFFMSDTSICKVYVIKFVVSQFPKITHPHPKLALDIFLTIFFLGVFLVIFFLVSFKRTQLLPHHLE